MTEPVHFLHLTDLHLSHPGLADPHLLTDTAAMLDRVLDQIAGIVPPPAFMIVSGDLTNSGAPESYRMLAEKMRGVAMPVLYALGNHDSREHFHAVIGGRETDLAAPLDYDRVIAGVHVIVLDTLIPGRVGGTLGEAQIAFLEGALGRQQGLAKIVVMHHPPALEPNAPLAWETLDWPATGRLSRVLQGRRDVAAILCGHIHVARVAHWHGIPVLTGVGLHNSFDPLYSGGLRAIEGAGFSLCTLRPSGLTATVVSLPSEARELRILPWETVLSLR